MMQSMEKTMMNNGHHRDEDEDGGMDAAGVMNMKILEDSSLDLAEQINHDITNR